jgi:hypothetical protein
MSEDKIQESLIKYLEKLDIEKEDFFQRIEAHILMALLTERRTEFKLKSIITLTLESTDYFKRIFPRFKGSNIFDFLKLVDTSFYSTINKLLDKDFIVFIFLNEQDYAYAEELSKFRYIITEKGIKHLDKIMYEKYSKDNIFKIYELKKYKR